MINANVVYTVRPQAKTSEDERCGENGEDGEIGGFSKNCGELKLEIMHVDRISTTRLTYNT